MDKALPSLADFGPKIRYIDKRVQNTPDKRLTESDLSQDQKEVLDGISSAMSRMHSKSLISLGGYAGSGKSTVIPFVAERYDDLKSVAFCCFTGKASNVLRRKLEAANIHEHMIGHVGTIHSLMYQPLLDERKVVSKWIKKQKLADPNGNLIRLVIVDECSMVSAKLLEDLRSYNVPVILVGDHGQLPPVEGNSVIDSPMFRLEKIHRQAADNPIIQLSQTIREKKSLPANLKESENIRFVSSAQLGPVLNEGFDELGLDMGLLVRSNEKRVSLNRKAAGDIPRVGNFVICLKNSPPIFNGMRGVIKTITPVHDHWYQTTIEFPDDGIELTTLLNKHQFNQPKTLQSIYDLYSDFGYPYSISDMGMLFDFGMALTVHKAQGSAFEKVVLCPEFWPKYDSEGDGYVRWLYTGVTRAAKTLYILK